MQSEASRANMAELICCTCLEPPIADISYYTLGSDPTASNDLNLREKLLYCVPEFHEVLPSDEETTWICSICCQALCWGYVFRRMCLDVKNKVVAERAKESLRIKEEGIDVDDTNFSVDSEPNVVAGDDIKLEDFSEEECRYSVVEITEPAELETTEPMTDLETTEPTYLESTVPVELATAEPAEVETTEPIELLETIEPTELDIQSEDYLLIEKACNTIPTLRERNITPEQFKCYIQLELLDENQLKEPEKTKSKYKPAKPFRCDDCGKRYANLFFFNCHQKSHSKSKNVATVRKNVPVEPFIRQNSKHTKQPKTLVKRKVGLYYIDLITSKFQSLTIRRKFQKTKSTQPAMPKLSPEPKRKRDRPAEDESMPLLFPSTQPEDKTSPHKTELLRKSLLNFERNHPIVIDLCEPNPHEQYGISAKPAFPPPKTTTTHTNACFLGDDTLDVTMTDYINSILQKDDSEASVLPPTTASRKETAENRSSRKEKRKRGRKLRRLPESTDHTYSLLSKQYGGKCLECGWTANTTELFDLHIDNYHAAWWLAKESTAKINYRILDELTNEKSVLETNRQEEPHASTSLSVDDLGSFGVFHGQTTQYVVDEASTEENTDRSLEIMELTVDLEEPVEELVGETLVIDNGDTLLNEDVAHIIAPVSNVLQDCEKQTPRTTKNNQLQKDVLNSPVEHSENLAVASENVVLCTANEAVPFDQVTDTSSGNVKADKARSASVLSQESEKQKSVLEETFCAQQSLCTDAPKISKQNTQNKVVTIRRVVKGPSKEKALRPKPLSHHRVVYIPALNEKTTTSTLQPEAAKITKVVVPTTNIQQGRETSETDKNVSKKSMNLQQDLPSLPLVGKSEEHAKPTQPQIVQDTLFMVMNPSAPNEVQFFARSTGNSVTIIPANQNKIATPPLQKCSTPNSSTPPFTAKKIIAIRPQTPSSKTDANMPTSSKMTVSEKQPSTTSEKHVVGQSLKFVSVKTPIKIAPAKKVLPSSQMAEKNPVNQVLFNKKSVLEATKQLQIVSTFKKINKKRDNAAQTVSCGVASNEKNKKSIVKEQTKIIAREAKPTKVALSEDCELTHQLLNTAGSFSSRIEVIYKEKDSDVTNMTESTKTKNESTKRLLEHSEKEGDSNRNEIGVNRQTMHTHVDSLKRTMHHDDDFSEIIKKRKIDKTDIHLPEGPSRKVTLVDKTMQSENVGGDCRDKSEKDDCLPQRLEESGEAFAVSAPQSSGDASKKHVEDNSTEDETKTAISVTDTSNAEMNEEKIEQTSEEIEQEELNPVDELSEGEMAEDACLESEENTTDQPDETSCSSNKLEQTGNKSERKKRRRVKRRYTFDKRYYKQLRAKQTGNEENESSEIEEKPPDKKTSKYLKKNESELVRNCLKKRMRNIMEKARIGEEVQLQCSASENADTSSTDMEKAIVEMKVTIPKWVNSHNQRRCKCCSLVCHCDTRDLHFDNYHTNNKRDTITSVPSADFYCNALIKLGENDNTTIETTICPTCKNSFNVEYYRNAHVRICGITVFDRKEGQTQCEEGRMVDKPDTSHADSNLGSRDSKTEHPKSRCNKSLSKKSTKKRKEVAVLSTNSPKEANKQTPKKKTETRRKSLVAKQRTSRPKEDPVLKRHSVLEQQIEQLQNHMKETDLQLNLEKKKEQVNLKQEKRSDSLEGKREMCDEIYSAERRAEKTNCEEVGKLNVSSGVKELAAKETDCGIPQVLNDVVDDEFHDLVLKLEDDDFLSDTEKEDKDQIQLLDEADKVSTQNLNENTHLQNEVIVVESDVSDFEDSHQEEVSIPLERKGLSDDGRCNQCSISLKPDSDPNLHFDNYHIQNERDIDTRIDLSTTYCNAVTKLKTHETVFATMVCPTCKITFNENYYINAHKNICGKTIKNFEEKLHSIEHKPMEEMIREVQERIDETMEKMKKLRKYECGKCEMSFNSNGVLRMHCVFKHGS